MTGPTPWNAGPGELASDGQGAPTATCDNCMDVTSARNRYRTLVVVEFSQWTANGGEDVTLCNECIGRFVRVVEEAR